MLNLILLFGSIVCYITASSLIAYSISRPRTADSTEDTLHKAFIFALFAVIAHILYASEVSILGGKLNFSLSSMSVLLSAILALTFMLTAIAMPIKRLGSLVFPVTALSLLFSYLWPSQDNYLTTHGVAFNAHILVSALAYSLLGIATIQAILYIYQERQIKARTSAKMLMALPPLQTMEQLLFRLLIGGFVLLTLTLFSGAIFSQQIFAHAFEFKHHTVLAIIGWFVFAYILYRRITSGMRGSLTAIWTIIGFLIIQLGYFGTKIVTESLTTQ